MRLTVAKSDPPQASVAAITAPSTTGASQITTLRCCSAGNISIAISLLVSAPPKSTRIATPASDHALSIAVQLRETVHAAQRSVPWVRERLSRLAREYVGAYEMNPEALEEQYARVSEQVIGRVRQCLDNFGPLSRLRIHGDCHAGNILWRENGGTGTALPNDPLAPPLATTGRSVAAPALRPHG